MTKIQSFIADYLYDHRLTDDGRFAVEAAEQVAATKQWDVERIARALRRTKTSLFRINTTLRKTEFTQRLAEEIVRKCKKPMPEREKPTDGSSIDQSVHFHGTVKTQVLQTGQRAKAIVNISARQQLAQMVEPAYLDAFDIISKVSPSAIKDVVMPIKAEEVKVRKEFEMVLGESFHATDSGVESCDTFSVQGSHDGKQCVVAAMFKGAGNKALRWPLQVGGCGKNGNQVVKLFEVPADVYIIQANGPFDPTLVKHIQDTADARAARGHPVRFILIDGVSTARLLRATGSELI